MFLLGIRVGAQYIRIAALLAAVPALWAQISPGELSRAHQSFEGALKCVSCHSFGTGGVHLKCLECHSEIRKRLEAKSGYHARIVRGSGAAAANDCARCHAEHNGRTFALVRWRVPMAKFDHRQAGLPLEGRHAALACRQCHQPRFLSDEARRELKQTNLDTTLLGLSPKCGSCHEDIHRGSLGQDCARCHSQDRWKDPPGFLHDKTAFPLTGAHARVRCDGCHKPSPALGNRVQYKNFVFQEFCKSCHADRHGGAFTADCSKCHTTDNWREVHSESTFDHSRTGFPLTGLHRTVACQKCHANSNFRAPVAHARCLDCHQDRHNGQLTARAGGECSACHTESGWKTIRFDAAAHAQTRYPLTGRHMVVACERCHPGRGTAMNFHPASGSCGQCHADRHAGQFAGAPWQNRCERCHEVEGWKIVRYTLAEHARTRFALTGGHRAVACSDCHRETAGVESIRFHGLDQACAGCHRNPHSDAASPALKGNWSCDQCHTPRNWQETTPFDHDRTGFPLLGRHRGAACVGCHKPTTANARRTIDFHTAGRACGSCHADIHAGQFRAEGQEQPDCGRCHTPTNWRAESFDHQKHSTFALTGAHERVPCRLCHAGRDTAAGRVVIYRGTPRRCEACHQ